MKVNNVDNVDCIRISSKNGSVLEITDSDNGDIHVRSIGAYSWPLAVVPQSPSCLVLTTPHQTY